MERTLHGHVAGLHSNDVQGYSSAIGMYLSKGEVPFTLRDDWQDELGWMVPSLDGGVGTLAAIMLGTNFFQFVGKESAYSQRMVKAFRDQWDEVHAATVDKIKGANLHVESYHAMDVREWLKTVVPADDTVAMFPPFFAGDYESQFAMIDTVFDWPEPTYPELDEDGKNELVELVQDRRSWLIGLHIQRPELRPFLRGRVQTANRGVPIFVYGSHDRTRIVQPRQRWITRIPLPKIKPADVLTKDDEVKIHLLDLGQFYAIRSMFMAKNINPGKPALAACAVSVGGKIIGAFATLPPKYGHETVYLMSDFPVSWSQYKHLAKLVVVAAMSEESKQLVQRLMCQKITDISTTAFTDRPVSMKYRGLMTLTHRTESKDGIHKNQLQYDAPMGQWTLQEGLAMWIDRWGGALK